MSRIEATTLRHDPSALLAQTSWTRALARSLASDAHLAERLPLRLAPWPTNVVRS